MNRIVFIAFCVFASSMLVVRAEPVEYRVNQRVRALEKQQQKPDANPDSENIEVTTVNNGQNMTSGDQNEKQQVEEVEEPKGKPEPETESDGNASEPPYLASGWKPSGNLLVLPPGVLWVASQTTTPAAETTTETEATTTETETESTATTTDEAETESATTEAANTDCAETTEENRLARTKVETTSEPDAESVDVEAASDSDAPKSGAPDVPEVTQHEQPPSPHAVNTFFVQLADGTLQRVVLLNNAANYPTVNYPNVPFTAALQAQPVLQAQPYVFGSAFTSAPRVVSYTAQYQVHGK